jgi:hypothetical protein
MESQDNKIAELKSENSKLKAEREEKKNNILADQTLQFLSKKQKVKNEFTRDSNYNKPKM